MALMAYRFAVAAIVTGMFSLWESGDRLVIVTLGGIAVGLAVGWIVGHVRIYIRLAWKRNSASAHATS